MFSLSRRWMIIVLAAWAIKIILIPLPPLTGDFLNWILGTQQVFAIISNGKFPSVNAFGVYLGLEIFLTPFYWFWTLLPIQHLPVSEMVAQPSLARYLLMYIMKLPILTSDFFAGLLVFILAKRANPSKARNAFLSWHFNPFNLYWLYWYTTMDVIPAVIVLVAIQYGIGRKWSRCALCLSLATVLRFYPILLIPFFAIYVLWVESRFAAKSLASFLASFVTPLVLIVLFLGSVSGTLGAALGTIMLLPLSQFELTDFLGFRLASFFTLTPFLVVLQIYATVTRWKKETTLAILVLAPLLVIFASGWVFGLHFIWASPLLSVYYAFDNDLLLFSLTFLSGLLSPNTTGPIFTQYFGWDLTYQGSQPVIDLYGPCMSGLHYGTRAVYLLKLNLDRLRG